MSNNQLYWITQISGWFFYWILSTLFNLLGNNNESLDVKLKSQLSITIFILIGILVTHLYRVIVKKHHWIQLAVGKLVYRLIFSILGLSIVIFIGQILFLWLTQLMPKSENLYFNLLQLLINITAISALWVFIYYSVQYFRNYRKVQLLSLKHEATIKDVTLNKLRSQLNPHFIFNSLNTIRALINSDPEKARDSITALSNIFRRTLQLDRISLVPFKEELQIVKDYLKLEEIRFEERLQTRFNISDDSWKFQVPPLMLQTLVENAIKHGISTLTKGGVVEINSQQFEDKLLIEIINTGQLVENQQKTEKGYGIENTKERLDLLYNGAALFKIENIDSEHVKTTILLPK